MTRDLTGVIIVMLSPAKKTITF